MTIALPTLTRRAAFRPTSLDREKRVVRLTISTGAPVRRRDHLERLSLVNVDPQKLIGLPLLDSHRQDSLDCLIGRIVDAGFDGEGLWADVFVSERAEAIFKDMEAGVIRSASIGYRPARSTASVDPKSGERVRTIEPDIIEVSLVSVPADAGATIRSLKGNTMEDELLDTMPEAEQLQIRSLGELANLPPSWAEEQIEASASITDARAAARAELVRRSAATPRIRVQAPTIEDPAVRLRAMEDALICRSTGEAPNDAARPFMGSSLLDMARTLVEARGTSTRAMDRDTIIRAAHTTGDFPHLLTGVGNRTVMAAYESAASPLRTTLSRRTTFTDFRTGTRLKVSGIGALEKVAENGEIRSTTRGEAAESFKLDTYASIFALTRQAIINDDLGVFNDWNVVAGRAAAETEANLLAKLLASNPVLGEDGKRLFHLDHGNLGTAATLDLGALADARLSMRKAKGLDGKTPIGVTPTLLIVGPEQELAAELVLATINPAVPSDANPFSGRLQLLVEPRITGKEWYVFASPASHPVLEHAYLSSAPGPQMTSRDGWDVLATEFRVVLDFGCGVVDWRGAYKNPGL